MCCCLMTRHCQQHRRVLCAVEETGQRVLLPLGCVVSPRPSSGTWSRAWNLPFFTWMTFTKPVLLHGDFSSLSCDLSVLSTSSRIVSAMRAVDHGRSTYPHTAQRAAAHTALFDGVIFGFRSRLSSV